MNTGIWNLLYELIKRERQCVLSRLYQVCLELIEVHIEGAVKPETGGDGGDYLGYQPVKVGVGRPLNSQVVVAEIVNGLKMA